MSDRTQNISSDTATPLPAQSSNIASKLFLWSAWILYIGYLLLSDFPPGESLLHTQPETLQTAINLSLNFWFVMPVLFPAIAPVIHPALEGLFNIVVAWGLLFWGFVIDGRHQRFSIVPFLVGTAFLTNVFYLLWLALRQPNPVPPKFPLNRFEKLCESKALPITFTIIVFLSVAWAIFARPEFGDLATRWTMLVDLIQSDRLAYSFFVDLILFWLFQSWLVTDDMARRQWHNPTLLWGTRLLPFFGLVIYFWYRPALSNEVQDGYHN